MSWGVDGETGSIVDMKDYGIWEPYAVKAQVYKTAIEVIILGPGSQLDSNLLQTICSHARKFSGLFLNSQF